MKPSMKRRLEGTPEQQRAAAVHAIAMDILRRKREQEAENYILEACGLRTVGVSQ